MGVRWIIKSLVHTQVFTSFAFDIFTNAAAAATSEQQKWKMSNDFPNCPLLCWLFGQLARGGGGVGGILNYWSTLLVFGLPTVKSSHVATYISDKIDIEVFYLKQLFNLEFFSRRFVSLLMYYPELPMWFRGKNICIFVLQCYVDFSVHNETQTSNFLTVCQFISKLWMIIFTYEYWII